MNLNRNKELPTLRNMLPIWDLESVSFYSEPVRKLMVR